MFRAISRRKLFRKSEFTDVLIAGFQQSYADCADLTVPSEAAVIRKYYDHLTPCRSTDKAIKGDAVISWPAKSRSAYTEEFPVQLQNYLRLLGIADLYLLNFTDGNLMDLDFENFRKRNIFRRNGGKNRSGLAYGIRTEELHHTFPVFMFSRVYDIPVIFLISAEKKVQLALRLCDDGNLHLNFYGSDREQFLGKAAEAGFVVGDLELCDQYSTAYLR